MKWPLRGAGALVGVLMLAVLAGVATFGGTGGCGGQAPSAGTLTYAELEQLWTQAGGPPAVASTAAAIAMAESGGKSIMQQGQPFATTGWGYWQITPGGPQYLDPMTNARAAVSKYTAAGGFTPWTTYNDGAYLAFLQSAGPQPVSLTLTPGVACAAAPVSAGGYINPLRGFTFTRTDQGVDANAAVGTPIVAPAAVRILPVCPGWYRGQPFESWQLLSGADAGQYQYVAEQITNLAPPGAVLQQGAVIAQYAASGTGIEYGWATGTPCQTLAAATSGYTEGQFTPAGIAIRAWLNALGAGAGPDRH